MANQISVNSSTGNIQITTSRSVIGTVANVATANFANYAGNVTASNQPNITNVGTLGNLSVSGTVTSGNVSTPTVYSQGMVTQGYDFVQMQYSNGVALPVSAYDIGTGSWFYLDAGGATFQSNTTGTFKQVILGNDGTINASGNITAPYFIGNGSQLTGIVANSVANANFANFAGTAFNVNASNITGTVANANYSAYAGQANTANLATYATTANSVAGSNVSGEVANANYATYAGNATYADTAGVAYSVDVANVVGIGNIAVLNLDGNASNILYGNGVFGPDTGPQDVANANYANFAGTAYSVDGANVSGEVANANYATYAGNATYADTANYATFSGNATYADTANYATFAGNATYADTAGVAYSVDVANVVGIGNIAVLNLDGNASNILYGNGVFGPDTGPQDVANANYANFAGDVVNSTQSNITSVGNLINLRVENANVHLGTNAGLGNIGTDIIAIGNNSAASNIVISTNFVSWDGGGFVLEVTDTTGIDRGYTVSGTGFTLGQTVNSVIDSGNLQMNDDADGTPSGVMTFSSMQGNTSVAIGNNAGYTTQNAGSVAIGNSAGYTGQFPQAVAVGDRAGETNQGGGSLALGAQAGKDTQGDQSTAIGSFAGSNNQGAFAVAIGVQSGQTTQGTRSVAIGIQAGQTTQGGFSVSIGDRSATTGQGANSVAIGSRAGNSSQGINSVAIGANAAFASQGANSIAIGKNAGKTSQANNSIILNATGANLNQTTANTFTVKPVRNIIQTNAVFYNTSTGEISYDTLANNTSNIGANIITANNVSISNSGFMKLASYTATALNAITGQIGWMAAVSDSAFGLNPNGMIAFWDTTNSRWSYVHDNSAV